MPSLEPYMPPDELPELTEEELNDPEIRSAEAWRLVARGWSQADVARKFGISRQAVNQSITREARRHLSRQAQSEAELEKIIAVLEAVVSESWNKHEISFAKNPSSLAGSNYLRLVLDAAREIARLRGFDALAGSSSGGGKVGKVEVVVKIGGPRDFESVIDVVEVVEDASS